MLKLNYNKLNDNKLNYNKLGFKCGLEIHGQLDTGKLFCRCPSKVKGENKDYIIKRKIIASKGETGEIDIAATYQMEKNKIFSYSGDRTLTCLVELDEEPPREVNQDAINVALQIAKLMKCSFVEDIKVMRKIVVDGSNVSGFQRTMLIGLDGEIKTSKGKIKIDTLCLEEESAQKVRSTRSEVEYSLDRLGVPLLEIATDSSIKNPEHAKECAEIIGMMIKSTGKMRRGIGTIRQDVNVSVEGHPRVEIKGFQDLKNIKFTIEKEVERQLREIENRKRTGKIILSSVRNAKSDGSTIFLRPMPGAGRMYPETDVSTISPDLENIKIPKLISDEKEEIQKLGLGEDLAKLIAKEGKANMLLEFSNKFKNIKPSFIAETILPTMKELKREGYDIKIINSKNNEILERIFSKLNQSQISKNSIITILKSVCEGKDLDKVLSENRNIDDYELEDKIKKIINQNKEGSFNVLMGIAMKELRGKADGKKISDLIKKFSSS